MAGETCSLKSLTRFIHFFSTIVNLHASKDKLKIQTEVILIIKGRRRFINDSICLRTIGDQNWLC